MLRTSFLLVVLVFALAACGVRTSKPYTAAGTAPCLAKKNGFTNVTTDFLRVGFVAGNAENGGLQARPPSGNTVTIGFAADEDSAPSLEQAFRLHAPANLRAHLADIMRTERNAVMVWTVTPASDELDTVVRCLKP